MFNKFVFFGGVVDVVDVDVFFVLFLFVLDYVLLFESWLFVWVIVVVVLWELCEEIGLIIGSFLFDLFVLWLFFCVVILFGCFCCFDVWFLIVFVDYVVGDFDDFSMVEDELS